MDKVDADEKKKMFDLMKDRELGGNMDWMYRGHKIDTEDYLLGKSVDKMITGEPTATEESTGGVGSLISERIKANVALDMQAKMREDPLFAIRRKEEDARKRLLENPVKMKQLQKLHKGQIKRCKTLKDQFKVIVIRVKVTETKEERVPERSFTSKSIKINSGSVTTSSTEVKISSQKKEITDTTSETKIKVTS
nr:hypothetical protein BaRGS_002179 [Batillaria attramentaria]